MTTAAVVDVKISADSQKAISEINKLSTNLGNASKKMGDVGKGMTKWITGPMLGAGIAILGLASKTGDYADRILDLNAITGMSTDAIQEWQHVAKIAGVETETVTGAVEGLVRRMPQLESGGGKAAEGLAKLGYSFEDLKAMEPDQMINTLIMELSAMEDPLEANAIGSQLFGGEWKNLAPILSMGADEIENAKNQASELGTVMGKDALEEANNFRIGVEELKAEFGGIFREVASKFMPVLTNDVVPFIKQSVIPALSTFADKITDLIDWFKGLSPGMQETIGILGGLLFAAGPIITVFSGIIGVFGMILSPMGLVVAGILAVIAVGILLWRNWDSIKAFASKLWDNLRQTFTNIRDGIKDRLTSMISFVKTIPSQILGFFKSLPSQMLGIGKSIVDGLWNGIKGMGSSLARNVGNFINDNVPGPVKKLLGIASPSKLFAEFGENVNEGLVKGMEDNDRMVLQASESLANITVQGYQGADNETSASGFTQNVTINSPRELSASEIANKNKQTARQLAFEWGLA